jgi:hypothetical protein
MGSEVHSPDQPVSGTVEIDGGYFGGCVKVDRVVALVMKNKPSVDFCGYWRRARSIQAD